jgi:hypothetical protein
VPLCFVTIPAAEQSCFCRRKTSFMGAKRGRRLFTCIACMQLAAAMALAAAATAAGAAASSDRRLLDVAPIVPNWDDVAAVSIMDSAAAAAAPTPAPIADIGPGMVQTAQIAPNAASEWAAGDLQQLYFPWYNQIGCFQDGTNFTAARRLARRLAVNRGGGLPPGLHLVTVCSWTGATSKIGTRPTTVTGCTIKQQKAAQGVMPCSAAGMGTTAACCGRKQKHLTAQEAS